MLDSYSDYEKDKCLGERNTLNQFKGINSCLYNGQIMGILQLALFFKLNMV